MHTHHRFEYEPAMALSHAPNSAEKPRLKHALEHLTVKVKMPIGLVIEGRDVQPGAALEVRAPHRHALMLGTVAQAGPKEMLAAWDAAAAAQDAWGALPWMERARVFLTAAGLVEDSWRATLDAACMVSLGKTVMEAELDAGSGLINVLHHAVAQAAAVAAQGTSHAELQRARGVVLAITPAASLARAAALVVAPALAGHAVVWRPSGRAAYLGHFFMRVLAEAGLPKGVINYVPGPVEPLLSACAAHSAFKGVSFGGREETLAAIQRALIKELPTGRALPPIHAHLGGHSVMVAAPNANVAAVAAACVRGAFGDAGQRHTSIKTLHLPQSLHDLWRPTVMRLLREMRWGNVEDFTTTVGPVLDAATLTAAAAGLEELKRTAGCKVIFGGRVDSKVGHLLEPAVVMDEDASRLHQTSPGPVLRVFTYADDKLQDRLHRVAAQHGALLSLMAPDRLAVAAMVAAAGSAFGTLMLHDAPQSAAGEPVWPGAPGSSAGVAAWMKHQARVETLDPPLHFMVPAMEAP